MSKQEGSRLHRQANAVARLHRHQMPYQMDVGDPVGRPPALFLERLRKYAAEERSSHYADRTGEPEFKEAIAAWYQRRGVKIEPSRQVQATQGGQPGLFFALMTMLEPGGRVGYLTPAFGGFPKAVTEARLAAVPIDFDVIRDPKRCAHYFSSIQAFIFNNPHNPTGYIFSEDEMNRIAKCARDNNVLVVSDFVYADIFSGRDLPLSFLTIAGVQTVEVLSASKTFQIAGWRLGAMVSSAKLMERLQRGYAQMNGVPVAVQRAYADLLVAEEGLPVFRDKISARRKLLEPYLVDCGFQIIGADQPRGANFTWARVPTDVNGSIFVQQAKAMGVLLAPGSVFGVTDGYVRVSHNLPTAIVPEIGQRLSTAAELTRIVRTAS